MAFSIASMPCCMPKTKTGGPILRRAVRCCSAASVSTKFDHRSYWTTLIKEVEQKLNDAVPLKYPELIHEAMRYSLLAKTPKRAPPVMCVAACELFGCDRAAALPTACALEMVHAASLIHDELPYYIEEDDDAPFRRGQACNHTKYGEDMAILAGDALLSRAFQHIVLHTPTQLVTHPQLVRVIAEIARSATLLIHHADKKLSQLGQCSAVCGGLVAGASDHDIQRLREYGRIVGILYRLHEERSTNNYGVELERANLEMAEELKSRAKNELNVFHKYGDQVLPLYAFIDYYTPDLLADRV